MPRLKEWLESKGRTHVDFATEINRTTEAVRRYCNGDRIPDRETMPLIVDATGGEVTANDFFGISASTAPKVCPTCDPSSEDPLVRNCVASNCGLAHRERKAAA
jgi:transcriptional regulator with XRE-family HTH domain